MTPIVGVNALSCISWQKWILGLMMVGATAVLIHPVCADYPSGYGLIKITSNPSGALVYVDGNILGESPTSTYDFPGYHTITMKKSGYNDYSTTVIVEIGRQSLVSANLIPTPAGYLDVITPPFADVYLDESYIGTTPISKPVKPGTHMVRVSKPGYNDYNVPFLIYAEQHNFMTVNLVSSITPSLGGSLNISSNPSGADIYIGGVYQGSTPENLTVTPGSYRVKLMKKGYFDYSTLTSIVFGVQSSVTADLVPAISLFVSSSPSGADVYIDGSYQGFTPINISDLAPGSHTVRVAKSEYTTYSTSVIISANNTTNITAYLLQKDYVKINPATVTTTPPDAPTLTPTSSSNENTSVPKSTTRTALLVPSVITGLLIAGVLLAQRKKGL